MRLCRACGEAKPLERFYLKQTTCKDCHADRRRAQRAIPEVAAAERQRDRTRYKQRPARAQRRTASAQARRAKYPVETFLGRVRRRAKFRGIEFSLTPADITPLPAFCPVLGIPLIYGGTQSNLPGLASIDRVKNDHGYLPGNVIVTSLRANKLKNDASVEELRRLASFYTALETKGPK